MKLSERHAYRQQLANGGGFYVHKCPDGPGADRSFSLRQRDAAEAYFAETVGWHEANCVASIDPIPTSETIRTVDLFGNEHDTMLTEAEHNVRPEFAPVAQGRLF